MMKLIDTIVTWGVNMAEMYPILWARDRKLSNPDRVKLLILHLNSNRASDLADTEIVFATHTGFGNLELYWKRNYL